MRMQIIVAVALQAYLGAAESDHPPSSSQASKDRCGILAARHVGRAGGGSHIPCSRQKPPASMGADMLIMLCPSCCNLLLLSPSC